LAEAARPVVALVAEAAPSQTCPSGASEAARRSVIIDVRRAGIPFRRNGSTMVARSFATFEVIDKINKGINAGLAYPTMKARWPI
jgi:hypothetical protein